ARLLPTKLRSYPQRRCVAKPNHVLIVGNHRAHKAVDSTAAILSKAFPATTFVIIGERNHLAANVRSYQSDTLDTHEVGALWSGASVVVLPSHVGGFGFGLLHSLAAAKSVVARDIPASREILATYRTVTGVFLYSDDLGVVDALSAA